MGQAALTWIVMTAIVGTIVAAMIAYNRRQTRLREERRERWAALGLGEMAIGGSAFLGGASSGGGGGCTAGGGCGGGAGCGGGGCGGGGCGGGGGS
jgi:hypothetical protein